eukprot:TRINITY_DN1848_c0_g1_i5.p1 TRINITY_DN1848_c0_g1~~TRINITY_DN1848_c0_g1_i5.p1  ORF type:complete len:638 (+),score=41.35 TRINITY_DN1848_c0_g1_i5:123-1916(+)
MEKYEIIRALGAGGCGQVYLVKEKATDKEYAMKEIMTAGKSAKKYENESKVMELLCKLDHKNIVKIIDSFSLPIMGKYVIVMEYCKGGSLEDIFKSHKKAHEAIPESKIIQWLLGLQYMHNMGVMHRDLKPDNILFDGKGTLKIGDFGISKVMTEKYAHTRVGTLYYMSPEAIQGKHGPATDMWGLGCVLYTLCCLARPFKCKDLLLLQKKIIDPNMHPAPIPDQYSLELRALVESMLNKDPNKRPQVKDVFGGSLVLIHLSNLVSNRIAENTPMEIRVNSQSYNRLDNKSVPLIEEQKTLTETNYIFFNTEKIPQKVSDQPRNMTSVSIQNTLQKPLLSGVSENSEKQDALSMLRECTKEKWYKKVCTAYSDSMNKPGCEIDLSCKKLTNKGAKVVAQIIHQSDKIRTTNLNYNGINDEGMEAIGVALKNQKSLIKLELGEYEKRLGEGILTIFLAVCFSLLSFMYYEFIIRPGYYRFEEDSIIGPILLIIACLLFLFLLTFFVWVLYSYCYYRYYRNRIGHKGIKAIAEGLRNNTALELLDLSSLDLDDAAVITLAGSINQNARLSTLVLRGNPWITDKTGIIYGFRDSVGVTYK